MSYSNFGQRLGAYLIDFLLLSPLFALQIWASGQSRGIAILATVLVSVVFVGYRVYCHAVWGQTVGKRVTKLRVVRLSGEAIGWRESLLRSAVEIGVTGLTLIAQVIALTTIPEAEYAGLDMMQRESNLQVYTPAWSGHVMTLSGVWYIASLITLFVNDQRRTLHDFIAGTVVANVAAGQPATPTAPAA
jgi:uncharacterized RDD family membrane protein YckC